MANITGTNGNDTIYLGFASPGVIGGPSTAGADTINGLGGRDFIDGGGGDDFLWGSSDNDILLGNTGNDWVDGGSGVDNMVGGLGNDRFDFDVISESGVGAGNRDIIWDFVKTADDRIDLSTIWADNGGDGMFQWKGANGAFTSANGGEVKYILDPLHPDNRIVQVDSGADGVNDVDMEIYLVGDQAANLTAVDFYL